MSRKNKNILFITILLYSVFLITLSYLLSIFKINNFYIVLGTVTGIILGWMYALISLYSTKLVFKTENPFLQLGFSVLKIGILFFALSLFYLFLSDKNIKVYAYGSFIGITTIFLYHICSSTLYIKERG